MFAGKRKFKIKARPNVGGTDYVPPTLCLRAASVPANSAANVERTESRGSVFSTRLRRAGWAEKIILKTPRKAGAQ